LKECVLLVESFFYLLFLFVRSLWGIKKIEP
jgi:hypothetical protein